MVIDDPRIARTSFQRLYDMILSHSYEEYVDHRKKVTKYKFFSDPLEKGKDAIFGLDVPLMKLVNLINSSARRYGSEKRVTLLHGPVGSSKSTIVRLLKKGLAAYSRMEEGKLFTFSWKPLDLPQRQEIFGSADIFPCPMHEEPLRLIPREIRDEILEEINQNLAEDQKITVEGDLCPPCRFFFLELMGHYGGDWEKVVRHITVRRMILSEQDRVGIGTFQPKDEKNQDSTELTGDINYRKIAEYGSDSDPRAFNFDGEFNIANRGLVEFIEVLKLDVAFLYDLLGASQEHSIKPKKFAQTTIDEVIIGHTNEAEFRKLESNEYMEALRDRTIRIDIPYITKLHQEVKIYERDFNPERIKGKHIAPHTLEMAAMWAVLTRLEDPKMPNLSLIQKLKLYDGKTVTGFTEDNVKELRKQALREGLDGISPRYIQDKISNALVSSKSDTCVNPFLVLRELEGGLKYHTILKGDEQRKRYRELIAIVRDEYEDIVKNEVQCAINADENAISRLCANYIDNVRAYTLHEKVKDTYTGDNIEADEKLMRSIEEKIDIPESRKDDFRREIMNYIAALALEHKTFNYCSNDRLRSALEIKFFEDQKDVIRLTNLIASEAVDPAAHDDIQIIKRKLIQKYGYCKSCATDVLNFVASVFARGDVKERRS
jgi:serine protein kinase